MTTSALPGVRRRQRLALANSFTKAIADRLLLTTMVGLGVGAMGLAMGPIYLALEDVLAEMLAQGSIVWTIREPGAQDLAEAPTRKVVHSGERGFPSGGHGLRRTIDEVHAVEIGHGLRRTKDDVHAVEILSETSSEAYRTAAASKSDCR